MRSLEKRYKLLQQELTGGISALFLVILMGTLGYWSIEKWSLVDSAYMTVITLSTVGFSEIHELSDRGRIFTISLIFMGVVTVAFIVNRFTEAVVQGYFRDGVVLQRQRRVMEDLKQHYILCGFGRTGRQIAMEFSAENIPFVVVDAQVNAVSIAKERNYMVLQADATLDETLMEVGIDRALCIVAAMPSDAENLYTIMSAKSLNPQIRTIARANTEEAIPKLQRGGADAVVSPYITGGKRMAAAALRPQVMDFVDGILSGSDRAFYMEEFRLDPKDCTYVGQTLQESEVRSATGVLVLAVRRTDGTLIAGPRGDTMLLAQDVLICMGTGEQLRCLNQMLSPLGSGLPRLPKQSH
ncbi:potassium channel family protein [Prochlorothrix hollandica]|uniref:potassium channel family protein n=1 Tax=Prochlorothrix hollandica TaxID=1223 RepID=UPI003341D5C6